MPLLIAWSKQWWPAVLAGIFFLGAVAYGFPDSPAPWFDQGINLGIAKTYALDGVYSLGLGAGKVVENRPLMISTNYPLLAWITLGFKLFGVGLAQAQLVMLAFLVVFLFVSFLLARRLFGGQSAFLAIGLTVTFLPFYGNGLSGGLGEVPGLAYLFLALLFFDRRESPVTALAGIFFGLAITTKIFYLLLLLPVLLVEIIFAWRERVVPWKRWFWLSVGIVLPLIIWVRTLLPGGFSSTGLQEALAYYRNPYRLVESTFLKNIFSFATESTLAHFAFLGAIVYGGFFTQKRWRTVQRAELILLLFVPLNLIYFLKGPGWFRYLFPAHLVLLVMSPGMLSALIERWRPKQIAGWLVIGVLGILIAAQTIHFFRHRSDKLYYNPAPRAQAAELSAEIPATADLYLVDHPELWFLLPGTGARQFIHMNPYTAFGDDFFTLGNYPRYVVVDRPEQAFKEADYAIFSRRYAPYKNFGLYTVFLLR